MTRESLHLTVCPDCYLAAGGALEDPDLAWLERYESAMAALRADGYGLPFPSSWPRDDGAEWPADDVDAGIDREGHFSSAPCDLCSDHLAGDRYPAAVMLERVPS